MHISNTMNLAELAERMGDAASSAEAQLMRDQLVESFDGSDTADIDDAAWLKMMSSAVAGARAARVVNASGLNEIRQFLADHHRLGGEHFTDSMLSAWADDAEFQMTEGNPPTIEIRARDSISGHAETYTISDAGIDTPSL